MKKLAPWFLLLALFCFTMTAFAADGDSDALPANSVHGLHPIHGNPTIGLHSHGLFPTPHGFPQGVDTITNFTGHFQAQGVFYNNTPHQQWEYSMVGNDPTKGGSTVFNAPIVPVSLDLRNRDGSPRFVKVVGTSVITCGLNGVPLDLSICKPLVSDATPFVQPTLNGPVFNGLSNYSSSSVPTQFTDAVQKAEFGKLARPDWHTLLNASVKPAETMTIVQSTNSHGLPAYQFELNDDGTCCFLVFIREDVFVNQFFPQNPAGPDTNSIIGQAELNGSITTKDISTFLYPNAYLFSPTTGGCCVLGFHTIDFEPGNAPGLPANGNLERFYILNYSSWISPGIFGGGFQDVTANSHEIAETFNDPFVGADGLHNITPFWQNPAGQCQDLMEDGDVIEDLDAFGAVTYPVTVNNFTYHPQNEALLPWFEFQQNSSAIDNAYSYPNEAILPHLSAPQPLNCGQ
jgi:hypothetical protein